MHEERLQRAFAIARDTPDRSRDVADVLEELAALDVALDETRRAMMLDAIALAMGDAEPV
jgi:hypothetical protein